MTHDKHYVKWKILHQNFHYEIKTDSYVKGQTYEGAGHALQTKSHRKQGFTYSRNKQSKMINLFFLCSTLGLYFKITAGEKNISLSLHFAIYFWNGKNTISLQSTCLSESVFLVTHLISLVNDPNVFNILWFRPFNLRLSVNNHLKFLFSQYLKCPYSLCFIIFSDSQLVWHSQSFTCCSQYFWC